jgi:hypothetical protein
MSAAGERTEADRFVVAERWDSEWAAQKAAEALRYLGRNYSECLENLRVLDEHERAAYEAAMRGDRGAYMVPLWCPFTMRAYST